MSPTVHPAGAPERRRLDAWKGIAQYLGRDVTTVRRWEKREGLPVHRHLHEKLGSVYAFTDEVDDWWRRRLVMLDTAESTHPIADDTENPVEPPVATHATVMWRPRRHAWWIGLGLLLLVGMTAQLANGPWQFRTKARQEEFRFAWPSPANTVVDSLAISPDGGHVAFAARGVEGARLWLRQAESQDDTPVPGTDDAAFPFWSADSEHIGFFAGGRLKCVSLLTHEIRDLAPAPKGQGGAWNERGDILFAPDADTPLMRVSSSGGPVTAATSLSGKVVKEGHAWPQFLPGGRRFLYLDNTIDYMDNTISAKRYGIYVGDLETGAVKRVLAVYSSARYADGFLLYSVPSKRALMAQSFDLDRLEVVGEPFPVAQRPLHRGELSQFVDFSVSRAGTIVVRSAEDERNKLVWIDRRSGRVSGTVGTPGFYFNPVLSPDERTFATTVTEENTGHVWLFDTATGHGTPLTAGNWDWAPLWSQTGDRLLFLSELGKDSGIHDRNLASGEETRVFQEMRGQVPESWNRDYLTFSTVAVQTKWDVWAWKLEEPRRAFPVVTNAGNDGQSQLSPDGRYIAYASDESGRFEVYVRSFPTSTETWRVSAGGGADPRWRRDGRELYFLAPDGKMMAASIGSGATFQSGRPSSQFDTGLTMFWQDTRNHYDVTADGNRFLVVVPDADRRYGPYTVIMNWQR